MTNKTKTWLLAGAALTLFAGAGAAIAHEPGKDEARMERGVHTSRHHGHDGAQVMIRHGDRTQHLKDVLQLRPEQEPALKAFLEATRRDQADLKMVRFDHDDDKTTPQRLAEMEARMVEHQAAMKGRIDATRTFYAQLDARQKKAFDAMPMLMMVGPGVGPMMIPHMAHLAPPTPPVPPTPPTPPGLQ